MFWVCIHLFKNASPLELPFSINKCIGGPKCTGGIRGLCNRANKLSHFIFDSKSLSGREKFILLSFHSNTICKWMHRWPEWTVYVFLRCLTASGAMQLSPGQWDVIPGALSWLWGQGSHVRGGEQKGRSSLEFLWLWSYHTSPILPTLASVHEKEISVLF